MSTFIFPCARARAFPVMLALFFFPNRANLCLAERVYSGASVSALWIMLSQVARPAFSDPWYVIPSDIIVFRIAFNPCMSDTRFREQIQ